MTELSPTAPGGGLEGVASSWLSLNASFADAGALGNFVENHDQTRWLLSNPDPWSYHNGLVAAFFFPGVAIAYYGTEQGMAGGQSDNDKRQPLWRHGGYNRSAPLYRWTKRMVAARKAMLAATAPETVRASVPSMAPAMLESPPSPSRFCLATPLQC